MSQSQFHMLQYLAVKKKNERTWYIPLGILLLALIPRLVFLFQFRKSPLFLPLLAELDNAFYDRWAQSIADGNWLGSDVFHGMPLYAYFLSLIYRLCDNQVFVAKLVQLIMGSTTCVMAYLIGQQIFNRTVGILAGLALAFYGMCFLYEGLLVGSALTMWLNTLAILILVRACHSQKPTLWLLGGLLIGLSALNRASALLFLPLAAIIAFFRLRPAGEQATNAKAYLRPAAISAGVILAASLVIAPVTLRNYLVTKQFILITAHGGMNLYIGNSPDADGTFRPPPGMNPSADKMIIQSKAIAQRATGRELSASEVSGYWAQLAIRSITESPTRFFRLLGKKLLLFWNAHEIYDIMDYSFVQRETPILRLPLLSFGIIGTLGLLGMVLGAIPAQGRLPRLLLYAFLLSHMCSILLFFVNSRYRMPMVPGLAIFSGYALYWFYDKLRSRKFLPVAISIVILAPLFFMVHLKLFTIDFAASHNNLGDIYRRKGLYQKAIVEFQEALRLNPNLQETHSNLGSVYVAMGLPEKALQEYQIAQQLRPQYDATYYDLGNVFYQMGRFDEAAANFAQVIRLNPGHAAAYNNLACVYMQQGRFQEAIEELKKALEMYPDYQDARGNLTRLQQLGEGGVNIQHPTGNVQ